MTVDGEEAEFDVDGRDVRITAGRAHRRRRGVRVTEIAYSGVPEPVVSAGFPTGWLTTDAGGAYVIGEPDGAATWFPSNDHPPTRPRSTCRPPCPAAGSVACNGGVRGSATANGDDVTWSWQEDDPIATYLVTVAIDHFRMVDEETDGGLPLDQLLPRGRRRPPRAETSPTPAR